MYGLNQIVGLDEKNWHDRRGVSWKSTAVYYKLINELESAKFSRSFS
jgi:hypothetical protein